MQASPFLWPSSQTDGMMFHVCSAVIMVLVFIPHPKLSAWSWLLGQPLLYQPVAALPACFGLAELLGHPWSRHHPRLPVPLQEAGALNKGESKRLLEALPLWESGEEQDKKPTNSFSELT